MAIFFYLKLADAVIITDSKHRIIDVNAIYENVTGYSRESVIGMQAGIVNSGLTPKGTFLKMKEALSSNLSWTGVFINRKKNKELWYSNITITPVQLDSEWIYVGVFRDLGDISEGVYVSNNRKTRIQNSILKVLALSCEIRDPDIELHLIRVQNLTRKLIYHYNNRMDLRLSEDYMQQITNASIMHDIGKSGIPEGILYKPGKLTFYERAIIETHTLIGIDILEKISGEMADELFHQEMIISKSIVKFHHEKWDGSGYPHQLKGDEIPFEAQVVSIVDVYDALTNKRSYKDAWTKGQAIAFLKKQKGISFNPELVDIFVEIIKK